MSVLSGLGKLASNFLGGGSGKSESAKSSQTQNMTTKGQTTASRQEFSDGFLSNLEQTANAALMRNAAAGTVISDQLDKVKGAGLGADAIAFDPEAYIRGITDAATNTINNTVRANTNAVAAGTGGSASGNSAAALLAGRLATDGAAQIAGVTQQAVGSANEIQRLNRQQRADELGSETTMVNSLSSTNDAGLTTLLNALRGGETYQEVNNNESSTSNTSGTTSSNTPFNWTKGLGNIFKDVNQE